MSEPIISVSYHIGKENVISGKITTEDWEGGNEYPYAVLDIGPITIFTPSGAGPTRDILVALRDEINKIEQEIPVVEVTT